MSNYFSTFDNPYAAMAQGTYPDQPKPFSNAGPFDFSKDFPYKNKTIPGGRHYSDNPSATDHPDWPQNGVVYLQPDPTLRSVPRTTDLTLPQMNGGYQSTPHTTVGHYQKGLLTDEPAGFNAYFLTDTPTLSSQTKNAYFATETNEIIERAKGLIFLCSFLVLVV